MGPLVIQAEIEVTLEEKVDFWTVKDLIVQFFKTLYLEERPYQVFVLEECA